MPFRIPRVLRLIDPVLFALLALNLAPTGWSTAQAVGKVALVTTSVLGQAGA